MLILGSKKLREFLPLLLKTGAFWALWATIITLLSIRGLRFLERNLLPVLGAALKVYLLWLLVFFILNILIYNEKSLIKEYLRQQKLIKVSRWATIARQILGIEYGNSVYVRLGAFLFMLGFFTWIYCTPKGLNINIYLLNWVQGGNFSAMEDYAVSIQDLFSPVHGHVPILWILFFAFICWIPCKSLYREKLLFCSKLYSRSVNANE